MAKLKLGEATIPTIDEEFDEITEDEEEYAREKLKSKWSRVAELAGDPDRLEEIANDLVEHFEKSSMIEDSIRANKYNVKKRKLFKLFL